MCVSVAAVAPVASLRLAAAALKYSVLDPVSKFTALPRSRSCVIFKVPLSLMLLPIVTWLSVPDELVSVPVLVSVPFLMVPVLLSVVAPVSAVVPPWLSIVPAIVLPPAPFRFTFRGRRPPTKLAPA